MAGLKEILEKLQTSKALDDGEMAALTAVASELEEVRKSRDNKAGEASRILAEKKRLQEQLASLESEIENVKTKDLTAIEKNQLELKKAQEKALKAEQTVSELSKKFETAMRQNKLAKVRSQLPLIDGLSGNVVDAIINAHFADADLDDENVVSEKINSFKESNKALIASQVKSGAGSSKGIGATEQKQGVPLTIEAIRNIDKSVLLDKAKRQELFKAVENMERKNG